MGFLRILGRKSVRRPERREPSLAERITAHLDDGKLSMVPVMLREVSALYQNPDATVADFARLNAISPASCMHLLVLANTVFYGALGRKAIQTTSEAVLRVGMGKSREVLESGVVSALFRVHRIAADFTVGALWHNSVAVAIGTRVVYTALWPDQRAGVDPYLAGLLHDAGIPVACEALAACGYDRALQERATLDERLVDSEDRLLGLNHQDIGEQIVDHWGLPPELKTVMGRHHEVNVPSGPAGRLVHCLRAAKAIALDLDAGYRDFPTSEVSLFIDSLGRLGIDSERYASLARQTADELAQFRTLGWFSRIRN